MPRLHDRLKNLYMAGLSNEDLTAGEQANALADILIEELVMVITEIAANNLINNADFSRWSDGPLALPDHWTGEDIAGVSREETTVRFGDYSIKLELDVGMLNPAFVNEIADPEFYADKRLTAAAYVRADGAVSGKSAWLCINDSGNLTSGEEESILLTHTAWTKIVCAADIQEAPSYIKLVIKFSGSATYNVLVDCAGLFVGQYPRDYEENPRDRLFHAQKHFQTWSYSGTLQVGLYPMFKDNLQSTNGPPVPFDCKATRMLVHMETSPTDDKDSFVLAKNGNQASGFLDINVDEYAGEMEIDADFEKGDLINVLSDGGAGPGADAKATIEIIPKGGVQYE